MSIGYIYVRTNKAWDMYDAVKLGITDNIPNRNQGYITCEIVRGYFLLVIEIDKNSMNYLETQLQIYFKSKNLHIIYDAGTEFFKKDIIALIIPYLVENNIKHKVLSKNEIDNLVRKIRLDQSDYKFTSENTLNSDINNIVSSNDVYNNINYIAPYELELFKGDSYDDYSSDDDCLISNYSSDDDLSNFLKDDKKITYNPRDYQDIIIKKASKHFEVNQKGLLIIPCGVGKTLISLWITIQLNLNTILIGVPNKLLLKQWINVVSIIFPKVAYISVSGGIDIETIIEFLKKNQKKCIVITTYSSSHKVYEAVKSVSFTFDMKINDECHHLTTNNMTLAQNSKTYVQMLNISSSKQLSLTATIKQLETDFENDNCIVSNDNIKYFGEIIEKKSLLWAIDKHIICDYVIQTIISDENQLEQQLLNFNIKEENDKRLFLGSFASLKSIFEGHTHHLLIYSNNKENSNKLITYIELLIKNNYFNIESLYYSCYNSEMNTKTQKTIINNFEKAKVGIIACVYCLGEGWDFPLLDGVVFAENMSSNIRIVQSALRASRKSESHPNKITKIILPILNRIDWLENNDNLDLRKVREVIYQMSLEDETIIQKLKVFNIEVKKQPSCVINKDTNIINASNSFGKYDAELTKKVLLKTINRSALGITYQKAMNILAEKNIKNKEDYYKLCDKDCRLPKDPEVIFKSQFTNWIEYLNIQKIYYDYESCRKKVAEYLIQHPDLKAHYMDLSKACNKLCNIDQLFPPSEFWVEYYNVKDLADIIIINNKKKKPGITM
jgi:superfamily II DNA or RNA helicase